MNVKDNKKIPSLKFSTESFKKNEQFDSWCAFTLGMCDLATDALPNEGFRASAEIFELGSIFMSNYDFPQLTIDYNADAIRRSRLDHWCFGVMTQGSLAVDSHQKGFRAQTGDLAIYSYASPFCGNLDGASYSSLFINRDDFWDVANELDQLSQLRVQGPMSQIISDFILSVKARAHLLTTSDAQAVNEAFGSLVRALARQTPTNLETAFAPIAATQFDRARRFIAANLKSPNLGPDAICKHLGLSRRTLYYLFENHGGVATFIRNRRLAASRNSLARSSERKLISSVAYEYGYSDPAVFSRHFRQRYGFNPSEARAAHLAGEFTPVKPGGTFVDWLMRSDPLG